MTRKLLARLAMLSPIVLLPTAVSAQSIDELRQLVQGERHQQAFTLGQKMSDQQGQVEFDLLFGVAATASGNPAEGVMALERVVLQEPANRTARHYLARAYYALGDDARAREEFEGLLSEAGPDETKAITAYLDAIRERESSYRTRFTASAEIAAGRDSNINSGLTVGGSVYVPGFGTLPPPDLNSVSVAEADSFTQIAIGGAISQPLAPGLNATLGLAAQERRHGNGNNEQFDLRNAGLSLGLSKLSDKSLYRLSLGTSNTWLGGTAYGTTSGLTAEWSYKTTATQQFSMSLTMVDLAFEDIDMFLTKDRSEPATRINASTRDSRRSGLSMRWATALRNSWQTVVGNTLSLSTDKNTKNRDDLSRNMLGWKLDLTARPSPRWSTGFAVGYVASLYNEEFSISEQKRQDFLSSADAFLKFALDRNWAVRADVSLQEQDSNIGLFDYKRNQILVKVQYQFK